MATSRRSSAAKGVRGRTVDAAAKAARERGAVGSQKATGAGAMARAALRDNAILAAHRAGGTTAQLARDWEVSQRQVQRVIKRAASRRSPLDAVPMDLVEESLQDYVDQMDAWASLAAGAVQEGNFNAAVAARRGYADARERYLRMLAELGKLPENLELFRMESEIERLGFLVLGALRDVADGKLPALEAIERVHELVGRRELPVIDAKVSGR